MFYKRVFVHVYKRAGSIDTSLYIMISFLNMQQFLHLCSLGRNILQSVCQQSFLLRNPDQFLLEPEAVVYK